MKKILITGANSYIGTSFKKYIKDNFSDKYQVDKISVRDTSWVTKDFSKYDAILHTAGIVHIKETKENSHLYYEVNRDLAIEIAKKAKADGAKQFIFMSTMSVYGMETGIITNETVPNPKTNYGKSKLEAENEINKLNCDTFKVCILRPPMVYGEGCKGNYQTLVKLVKLLPIFPNVHNQRSMIYVDNLSSFIKSAIDNQEFGCFKPQNSKYVNTSELAFEIARDLNKKILISDFLGLLVKPLIKYNKKAKKAFGNLVYEGN